MCMQRRMFIAIVHEGKHRNLAGLPCSHIADASCSRCGFSFGRIDVRDDVTGQVRKGVPSITDRAAVAAAVAAGLPPVAALYDRTEAAVAAARASASPAAPALASLAPGRPTAGVGASLRSSPTPAPAAAGPVFDGPAAAGFHDDAPADPLAVFLEQHEAG
jgi:hypothetical protein